ncbi:unnamed protein product [marine sediment metagenome]|uniref:Transcription regulator PadR N-terminal domain-containing protein n=1 Tax=marine sediment metagenome TaxID=412755 RepID=X0VTY2_9ZZZZ
MDFLSRKEELILLAIWKLGDNAYGITVRDALVKNTGIKWLFGSIYTPLTKLFDKGLITKSDGQTALEQEGRPRVYFKLTPKGKKALAKIKELNAALWADAPILTIK